MSTLGKLGQFFTKVGKVAPGLMAMHPALAPIAGPVAAAIYEAEAIKGATGEQKLAHVVAVAVESAKAVNAGAKKKILDPVEVKQAAAAVVSATVNVANVLRD